jgi:hypothetical protein
MPVYKINQPTLSDTISAERNKSDSYMKDALPKFRAFIREHKDDNDDEDDKLDSEMDLEFLLRTGNVQGRNSPNVSTILLQLFLLQFFPKPIRMHQILPNEEEL